MDSKLIILVLVACICGLEAKSAPPSAIDIITGKDKDIPVQPIDGEEEDKPETDEEETVEEEEDEEEEDSSEEEEDEEETVEEEEASGEEEEVHPCADITGVFSSTVSSAKLVIVQEADGTVSGLFRNNSDSAWHEFSGFRGAEADSAFGFTSVRDEIKGVTSVTGICRACDGSLDLSLMTAIPNPGKSCKSVAIPMPGFNYKRSGDAAQALELVGAFREVEDGSGDL